MAWRREFLGALADMGDEFLPEAYAPTLGAGTTPDVDDVWRAHTILQPLAPTSARSMANTAQIVAALEERDLLTKMAPSDLFPLLLGRRRGRDEPGADTAQRMLTTILRSPEFSRSLPWIAKMTFQRGRWNYFVHVPKTAGSQFQAMLWTHFGPGSVLRSFPDDDVGLSEPWVIGAWLQRLRDDDDPEVWLSGHLRVADLRPAHSIWPSDRLVTLIREPVAQTISAFNYYVGLRSTEEGRQAGQRYFQAVLERSDEIDLEALDTKEALTQIAAKDARLRPAYYFNGPLSSFALQEPIVCGFQDHVLDLLQFLVGPERLNLPSEVLDQRVRLNPSAATIDRAGITRELVTSIVRTAGDSILDFYAMQHQAGGLPYVYSE